MRLYGGLAPYAVGHFLANVLLSVSSFSYLLDESLIWPSPLIRVEKQNMSCGHFLIRLSENGYLDNQKVSEKMQHMAEKLSLRCVEIRGLF